MSRPANQRSTTPPAGKRRRPVSRVSAVERRGVPLRARNTARRRRGTRIGNGDGRLCVLHLITRLDRGGSAENTLLTVTGLDQSRYRVFLASGASAESRMTPDETASLERRLAAARAAGVELVVIPSLVRRISPWRDAAAFLAIIRLIRRLRPDVVHTHTSKAGALGRLAARLCRVPTIVHTPHGHIFYGYYGRVASACAVAAERWLGRMTDALVALTEAGRLEYAERRIVPPDRLHVIHSGIELDGYARPRSSSPAARKALGLPVRGPVIGVLGRLVRIKGHRYLIEALPSILKSFPSATLLCVGEGPEREALVAGAARAGVLDRVRLVGAQHDLPRFIAACDVIVQPSLNEGMGRTVLEALVMGRPVIASQVGGLPDLIDHGVNGLLVPPASSAALAHAVCSLLLDSGRLKRMSEEARRSIGRQFSVQAMIVAIDRLYTGLLLSAGRTAYGIEWAAARAVRSAGRRRPGRSRPVDVRRD
ncbi:MAG TPA: glycosyltransferase family 4 protein [Nitrospiria bacterium]|nr:glycosyltransferase family 4 protein [Nitrospiria bacterium]